MIHNLIYGTGGDSSQSFNPTIHECGNIDTTQVLVNGVPVIDGDSYSQTSNIETIERDLSMYNIETIQVWKDAADQTDLVPMLKTQIDGLPFWNGCCDTTLTNTYQLVYGFNKYGINARIVPFLTYPVYNYLYVSKEISGTDNRIWESSYAIKTGSSDITYWNRATPTILYLAKSSTTNGFWTVYPPSPNWATCKMFITQCIDEDAGTVEYRPVIAKNGYISQTMNDVCYTYLYNNYYIDLTNYSMGNSGYSGAYVLKQLRILNYIYPDVYIISGGLSKINQDIVHIDNHTYIHLTKDLFIKIR